MVIGCPRWVYDWSDSVYGDLTPGEYMPDNKVQRSCYRHEANRLVTCWDEANVE